ncbi:Cobalt/zinc/cadmium efflux RND transporter, membrane fusion protein, CzcB family [hydrothermal vent metagenome]|uniref:Cobalt/zinc/cadmium efflux RND transporter, membrane fusion protein, CzcB family n=1 Tax=hydrothermal vent metagenome TaxID=652676 RepID=A0A3B0SPL9_9ZZZZ
MNKSTIILAAVALSIGLAGGYVFAKVSGGNSETTQKSGPAEKEILYWKAPMDPNFRSENPGKSPMGMDLVPVYAGGDADGNEDNLVRINATVQNNIGVRVAKVERATLYRNIDTVGFVRADDDKTAIVDVRTEGWIEKLFVKSPGETVRKGQALFDLYSRPLVSAQEEYLQAERIGKASLIRAAKSRLDALGMGPQQIARIKKSGKSRRLIRIFAPQDGVITMLGAGEGAFVKPGRQIMMLADLSSVWVQAEVFENEATWVKTGQKVQMRLEAMPGRNWQGEVDYIYPTVNAGARTVQVRLRFDNPDGALKPDMYAKLSMQAEPHTGVLAIDREALIRAGKSDRVILSLGDGQFQPATVVAGMESDGRIEILEGLVAGEEVVVSAQFLIDSEASLRGTTLRMSPPSKEAVIEAETMGVVESLMKDHGMITIDHQPIKAFGWPAMVMDFVTEPENLAEIEEGDTVHFKLLEKANDNGDFTIIAIKKMPAKPAGAGEDQ